MPAQPAHGVGRPSAAISPPVRAVPSRSAGRRSGRRGCTIVEAALMKASEAAIASSTEKARSSTVRRSSASMSISTERVTPRENPVVGLPGHQPPVGGDDPGVGRCTFRYKAVAVDEPCFVRTGSARLLLCQHIGQKTDGLDVHPAPPVLGQRDHRDAVARPSLTLGGINPACCDHESPEARVSAERRGCAGRRHG